MAMIELIHNSLNLVVGYVFKTATFGKVLSTSLFQIRYLTIALMS